ncbi:MAG: hypothetical protein Q8P76_01345 [bacterium]|nr:hypothetical protein [bacterium]
MRIFIYIVIGIVAVAVIAGFFIVGSPREERLRRFDERRVSDLQFLQSEIINYWVVKEKLPENLAVLNDDTRGVRVPRDPETGEAGYVYTIQDALTFVLCADFARASLNESIDKMAPRLAYPTGYYGEGNWDHTAGKVCFERTIDKDRYKSVKPI